MSEVESVSAAVLAGLASMSRRRLLDLCLLSSPVEVLHRLKANRRPESSMPFPRDLLSRLHSQANAADSDSVSTRLTELNIEVLVTGSPTYPRALEFDDERPGVLFCRGATEVLTSPRVGIVGTRNATAAGRATARELGEGLARAGVCVVSGLASGVDAAAHWGAVGAGSGSARAVAVVGNGLDICYPKHNADLFHSMCADHLVLSEWPPGTRPEAYRFPLRNRIIAALSEVLVVIESRERGGSLITARACLDRGIEVMVVPGSPRSKSSAGTNLLLRDGATPVTCVDDVLDALGSGIRHLKPIARELPSVMACSEVIERVGEGPVTLDALVAECGVGVAEVVVAVGELIASGHLVEHNGWFESASSRLVNPGGTS